jgi:beta-lactam-binding protein with PASTA domain/tRNA A-37 threonylcarbamoyl transferase component Bud32
MGTIYEGLDTRLDRKVAVKIMHPHLAQDEEFISRFIREAKAAASLSHPNIVNVMDQGWNQSGIPAVFLVMELVEGQTLRELIASKGKFSVSETLNYLSPVVSALAAAHQIGIVHRDIKPENILISNDGRIKIADFGLARGTNLGQTMTAEASVILGSVSYLSPEQVQRGISDSRSDIYSVGVMAFEMLTGKRPHISDSPLQIAYLHVNEDIPKISSKGIKLPKELDELIYSATSRNPDDRPKDAGVLSAALRNIQIKFDPTKQQMSLELDLPVRTQITKASKVSAKPEIIEEELTREITKPVKREKVKPEKVRRERKSRKGLAKVAIVLAIAVGFGGWWTMIGPGSKVTVPSLIGGTMEDAANLLTPVGLVSEVASQEFNEEISKGIIISTNPEAGAKIDEGGLVRITLSKGPERYLIPSVAQLTVEAATKILSSIPIADPVIQEVFNNKIPKGFVIGTEPTNGAQVRRGAGIKLIVSRGVEQITLINFVNKSGEEALNTLTEAGFKVSSKYVFSETVPLGAVVSQLPSEVKGYPKGSSVALSISKGSAYVFVPNVYSLSESKAKSILTALDLQVTVKRMGNKAVKQVTAISPKIGTKVLRGSKVTITVG